MPNSVFENLNSILHQVPKNYSWKPLNDFEIILVWRKWIGRDKHSNRKDFQILEERIIPVMNSVDHDSRLIQDLIQNKEQTIAGWIRQSSYCGILMFFANQ